MVGCVEDGRCGKDEERGEHGGRRQNLAALVYAGVAPLLRFCGNQRGSKRVTVIATSAFLYPFSAGAVLAGAPQKLHCLPALPSQGVVGSAALSTCAFTVPYAAAILAAASACLHFLFGRTLRRLDLCAHCALWRNLSDYSDISAWRLRAAARQKVSMCVAAVSQEDGCTGRAGGGVACTRLYARSHASPPVPLPSFAHHTLLPPALHTAFYPLPTLPLDIFTMQLYFCHSIYAPLFFVCCKQPLNTSALDPATGISHSFRLLP